MSQLPLWSYPARPGYKGAETSKIAAQEIESIADTLRSQALYHITGKPMTADEVANALRVSVLSVRPRIAELNKMGLIEDSEIRRRNESGRAAIVWRRK